MKERCVKRLIFGQGRTTTKQDGKQLLSSLSFRLLMKNNDTGINLNYPGPLI